MKRCPYCEMPLDDDSPRTVCWACDDGSVDESDPTCSECGAGIDREGAECDSCTAGDPPLYAGPDFENLPYIPDLPDSPTYPDHYGACPSCAGTLDGFVDQEGTCDGCGWRVQ